MWHIMMNVMISFRGVAGAKKLLELGILRGGHTEYFSQRVLRNC